MLLTRRYLIYLHLSWLGLYRWVPGTIIVQISRHPWFTRSFISPNLPAKLSGAFHLLSPF